MGALLTAPTLLSSLSRCNNENEWYQIHENIIRKSNTKYSAPSTNYGKYVISADLLRVWSPGIGVSPVFPFYLEFRDKKSQRQPKLLVYFFYPAVQAGGRGHKDADGFLFTP